jgi:TatD DNase family protein
LVGGAVAYEDILEIIKSNRVKKKGVVHSFIGSYKMAQEFIEEGFLIGLNGIITYSESYDRLIREIGLENIIIETDAPYLTPAPLGRYSRNEPLNVKLVAQKIADVLGVKVSEVEKGTTENAKKLFKL